MPRFFVEFDTDPRSSPEALETTAPVELAGGGEAIGDPSALDPSKLELSEIKSSELLDSVEQLGALDTGSTDAVPETIAPEAETLPGFGVVLKNANFLKLWTGQIFSQIADKVYLVLMIMLISRHFETPGQTISGWVSAIMVAFTIPAVLIGSIAGVYVDRHPKKNVLVLSNLMRGAFVFTLPWLLPLCQGRAFAHIPLGFYILLTVTFLVSSLTQFFAPAEQAVIPLIVNRSALLSANSLYTTTMMAAMIIGFAVGEPLLDWADHWTKTIVGWNSGETLFVGSCYGLAGLILRSVTVQETLALPLQQEPFWTELREGWRYLGQNKIVRNALFQLIILFSVFAALAVLAVRLAEIIPQLESDQFGWLLAVGSLGMGLGAIGVGQLGDRFGRSACVRLGNWGMAASLFSLALVINNNGNLPGLNWVLMCITSLGFFAALIGIPLQTTIQEQTSATMRGKVFGLQNNGVNIALSLPLVLAGIGEQTFGLAWTFFFLATIVFWAGLLQPEPASKP